MTSVDVYYPINCYNPVDRQVTRVCSTCYTQILCNNPINIPDSYFLCNHCLFLQNNLKKFDDRFRTIEGRLKGQRIFGKISFLDNYIKGLSKKIDLTEKSFSKLNDSTINKNIQLKRKSDFNIRVKNLESLLFWNKIINFNKDKIRFDNYIVKNNARINNLKLKFKRELSTKNLPLEKKFLEKYNKAKISFKEIFNRLQQQQIWISERDDMIERLLNKTFELEEKIKSINNISDSILPTMKDQTLYIEETYKKLNERVLKVEEEMEDSRLKSKDYKELRKLRHDLTLKDGDYNRFKKLMNKFNFNVKTICFIIGLNVLAIFYLLAHIYFKY